MVIVSGFSLAEAGVEMHGPATSAGRLPVVFSGYFGHMEEWAADKNSKKLFDLWRVCSRIDECWSNSFSIEQMKRIAHPKDISNDRERDCAATA